MNTKKQQDIEFGLIEEDSIQNKIEAVFGLLSKTSKFSPFDFKNEEYTIELKSRRITHNRYGSQIFGQNKLRAGWKELEKGRQPVFVFNCTDGIFYWEQKEGEYYLGNGGRYDRGKPEPQKQVFVKTQFLKCLNDLK